MASLPLVSAGTQCKFSADASQGHAHAPLVCKFLPCLRHPNAKPRKRNISRVSAFSLGGNVKKHRLLVCRAQSSSSGSSSSNEVYNGVYGPWSVDATDIREVLLYRAGLVTAAASFVAVASKAFLPEDSSIRSVISAYEDVLFSVGAGGLGMSLLLIHIYVTPLKRTLQFLWTVGVAGSLVLAFNFAAPAEKTLVEFVVENRAAIWAVGPLFASLTGLVFKEGLCYGKLEAGLLFFIIPSLLLGHLAGVLDQNAERAFLTAWMLLFSIFAARKFTQPVKDDIGDKSIFMFNALPENEQEATLRAMQERKGMD